MRKQRPATALASRIEKMITRRPQMAWSKRSPGKYRILTVRTLKDWLKLAIAVDARGRNDGSARSKHKKH